MNLQIHDKIEELRFLWGVLAEYDLTCYVVTDNDSEQLTTALNQILNETWNICNWFKDREIKKDETK